MEALEHAPAHILPYSEWSNSENCVPGDYTVDAYEPPCKRLICQTQFRMYNKQRYDEFDYS
jgi:hypothetical protein